MMSHLKKFYQTDRWIVAFFFCRTSDFNLTSIVFLTPGGIVPLKPMQFWLKIAKQVHSERQIKRHSTVTRKLPIKLANNYTNARWKEIISKKKHAQAQSVLCFICQSAVVDFIRPRLQWPLMNLVFTIFLKKKLFSCPSLEKKVCIDENENDFHFWPLIELYKSRTSANWPAREGKMITLTSSMQMCVWVNS